MIFLSQKLTIIEDSIKAIKNVKHQNQTEKVEDYLPVYSLDNGPNRRSQSVSWYVKQMKFIKEIRKRS